MSVLVNILTVNSSAGTGDSNIDTAAWSDAVDRIVSAGGGVIALPPAESGEYLFDDEIGIPSNCHVAGAGRAATVVKVPDGANITPFTLRDAATGATSVSISGMTIDGNKANNSGTLYGIYLVRASDFSVFDVELKDINGSGLTTDGMQTFCGPGHVERVYAHDCDNIGIQISNATRRVTVVNVHAERCTGYGLMADASELTVLGANVRRSAVGAYIRNVFGCVINDIVATLNDGHGILVAGMVRSQGRGWVALQNGRTPTNTADDVHFGPNPVTGAGLGYGESKDNIIDIVAGPSSNHYANYFGPSFTSPTERYAVYFEDEVNLSNDITISTTTGAVSGDVRLPTDLNKLVVRHLTSGQGTVINRAGVLDTRTGFAVLSKSGVPSDSDFEVVADGMLALDNSTGKLYVRSQSAWVAQS